MSRHSHKEIERIKRVAAKMTTQSPAQGSLAEPICSARLEAMKAKERATGRIWCSLCKTYGSHYSSECPTPLGMVAPNAKGER